MTNWIYFGFFIKDLMLSECQGNVKGYAGMVMHKLLWLNDSLGIY